MRHHDNNVAFLIGAIVCALLAVLAIGLSRSTYTVAESVRVLEPGKPPAPPSKFLIDSWNDRPRP
jgi:hypothetical protein